MIEIKFRIERKSIQCTIAKKEVGGRADSRCLFPEICWLGCLHGSGGTTLYNYWCVNKTVNIEILIKTNRNNINYCYIGRLHYVKVQHMSVHNYCVRHCGPVVSAPAWNGTGCEFDSWQCRIYIPCSLSLRLLGSHRGSLGSLHIAWHKNCVKKQ